MRINKEELARIAALSDEELWRTVVTMASSYGFKLPEKTPEHSELEKLRATLNGSKLNVSEAVRLLNNYKRGC